MGKLHLEMSGGPEISTLPGEIASTLGLVLGKKILRARLGNGVVS